MKILCLISSHQQFLHMSLEVGTHKRYLYHHPSGAHIEAKNRQESLASISSTITIETSKFHDNSASRGGVLASISGTVTIEASEFHNNSGKRGGVLHSRWSSTITIETSEFYDNYATVRGVLHSTSKNIKIAGSNFTNNVSPIGAIIYATSRSMIQHNSFLFIDSNMAHTYAMIYLSDSEFIGNNSGNATFSNNYM